MTIKEIRQKAIEWEEEFTTMCLSKKCEECEYCDIGRISTCLIVYGYEHGFVDVVEFFRTFGK